MKKLLDGYVKFQNRIGSFIEPYSPKLYYLHCTFTFPTSAALYLISTASLSIGSKYDPYTVSFGFGWRVVTCAITVVIWGIDSWNTTEYGDENT